jgi:hypothetical protein
MCADLLINNGLPLKFNWTFISGRRREKEVTSTMYSTCYVVLQKTLLRQGLGSAITEIVMMRDCCGGGMETKKKRRKTFATRIGHKTTSGR